jgi:hypothetical protein
MDAILAVLAPSEQENRKNANGTVRLQRLRLIDNDNEVKTCNGTTRLRQRPPWAYDFMPHHHPRNEV